MIKTYYFKIIKPGIVFSNLISVIGGFFLSSQGNINYTLLCNTLIGMALVISSSCILNNYIDRDIDQKMDRTKNRILAKNIISAQVCCFYSFILGITGLIWLYITTNILVVFLTITGWIIYIIIYSLCIKRKSVCSTWIGSLSGAIPPIVGYCSVSNRLDVGALILLLIFSIWQIPHFYSIALLYLEDYKKANIPIFPLRYGISNTKHCIIFCIIIFTTLTFALSLNNYMSHTCLMIQTIINVCWLIIALQGYTAVNHVVYWAKKMFIFSIIVIVFFSITILLYSILIK